MAKFRSNRNDRALLCLAAAAVIACGNVAHAVPVTVGAVQVEPDGSRLYVQAYTGTPNNPTGDSFEFDNVNESPATRLNTITSHTSDSTSTDAIGTHTAHAKGTFECHVTQSGVGGLTCTIVGDLEAKVVHAPDQSGSYADAYAQADTAFLFQIAPEYQFTWNFECHAKVTDESDQKNQGRIFVRFQTNLQNQPTVPVNLVLGGLPNSDGYGTSSQLQADFIANGETDYGYGNSFMIFPRITVNPSRSDKNVKTHLSITLKLERITGACCDTPVYGCQQTTAALCGQFAGATYMGVDTDCGSCPGSSPEIHWANAVNGNYSDATKWTPQSIPESNAAASPPKHDIAFYDQPGGYTVSFPGPATSDKALIRNGLPTFLQANYQLKSLATDQPSLEVGAGGTLTLQNCPSLAIVHGCVGDFLPGASTLNLFDSNMSATGFLKIGELAPGKVNVIGNSLLNTQDSRVGSKKQGDAIVDGATAEWKAGNLAVAMGAPGTLIVQGGGKVTASNAFVGYHNGLQTGVGQVTIKGLGSSGDSSKFKVDNKLTVGELGIGTLNLTDKGVGAFKDVTLAEFGSTSGTLHVNSAASSGAPNLDISGMLIVGKSGIGELKVQGGANVSCHSVLLAQNSGSKGTVNVSGTDTLLGTGTENFVIGEQAGGVLNILDGAKVATAKAILGNFGSATVLVKNGPNSGDPAWRLSGDLLMNGNQPGAMTVENAMVYVLGKISMGFGGQPADIFLSASGKLKVDQNSIIGPKGQLFGSGLYACPFTQVIAPGKIDPGIGVAGSVQVIKAKLPDAKQALFENAVSEGIGTLTVDGDVQFDEGSILHIDVSGAADGQHDVLHVTGTATFNGTLEVNFIDGFVPQPGEIIAFLQIDGATIGQFSEIKFLGLPEGFAAEGRFINGALEVGGSSPAPLPAGICGIGLCGAGMMPLVSAMLIGHSLRRLRRAVPRRIR